VKEIKRGKWKLFISELPWLVLSDTSWALNFKLLGFFFNLKISAAKPQINSFAINLHW